MPFHCLFCQVPLPLYKQKIGPFLCSLCRTQYFHPDISIVMLKQNYTYFTHINLFIYDDLCRDSIIRAKFNHSLPDAAVIIESAKETLMPIVSNANLINSKLSITCVPGVNKRLAQRKFDFVHHAAQSISVALSIPFKPKLILRTKDTPPQKNLNQTDRYKNLSGAFAVPEKLHGQSVLLIDDIYTTGSTVAYIAKLLYKKGACKVYVLTFALRP